MSKFLLNILLKHTQWHTNESHDKKQAPTQKGAGRSTCTTTDTHTPTLDLARRGSMATTLMIAQLTSNRIQMNFFIEHVTRQYILLRSLNIFHVIFSFPFSISFSVSTILFNYLIRITNRHTTNVFTGCLDNAWAVHRMSLIFRLSSSV